MHVRGGAQARRSGPPQDGSQLWKGGFRNTSSTAPARRRSQSFAYARPVGLADARASRRSVRRAGRGGWNAHAGGEIAHAHVAGLAGRARPGAQVTAVALVAAARRAGLRHARTRSRTQLGARLPRPPTHPIELRLEPEIAGGIALHAADVRGVSLPLPRGPR